MANPILPPNDTAESALSRSLRRCDVEVQSATDKIAAIARAASQAISSDPQSWLTVRTLLQAIERDAMRLQDDVDEIAEQHGCYQLLDDEVARRLIDEIHAT